MTAKNRQKSGSVSEKSPDDAPRKSQRSATNGASGPGAQGPRSRSCLGLVLSTLFYVAFIGAGAFAAFYVHQAVEEVRATSARLAEGAQRSAEVTSRMESVVHQVEFLKGAVGGLESSLDNIYEEIEKAVSRLKAGEVENRRLEEALQNLQNDLLRDLSEGLKEVKEAREQDFSSLERTVEERLAEVSQSIKANMADFTGAQGEVQSQLANLKARLGDLEDPALIKQEISAIVDAVAEIKSAKEAADTSSDSLREQIGAVREELQTRNREVASLSQEVQTVRSVVQETVGNLRQSLSAAEAEVQVLKDKTLTAEIEAHQAAEAVRNVEKQITEAAAQAQRRSDDLEARIKASEESGDLMSASLSETTSKVESLLAKYDNHESVLAAQGQAVVQDLQTLKSGLEELQSDMASLDGTKTQQTPTDSSLDRQVGDLEKRLAALEDSSRSSSSIKPEQVESLRSMVAGLEEKADKLEGHDQAIAALQRAVQETTQTLAALSGVSEETDA